mmetsp:Transcript_12779/g.38545  ORF Transcript_12779/g.38545 Transcript_12779/m.38545 type:complete len:185 (-) Transcript_12779:454-1008(-)
MTKVEAEACRIETRSDWRRRKAAGGRCGLYRFHREITCCGQWQPCGLEFWQQAQEFCTLNCFEAHNEAPGKLEGPAFYASLVCQPWLCVAGSITATLALAGCVLCDTPRAAAWALTCGFCGSTPVDAKVRTILSPREPIEPVTLSVTRQGERRPYTMHYSAERPCLCAHCCTCFDDLMVRLPGE